jgi:broad specificity phosphatase PhoE
MKLIFIRHGQTVDNIADKIAGSIDSRLTNFGFEQAQRLGTYFADRGLRFTHIFASDKQRAATTAQSVADAQNKLDRTRRIGVVLSELLREQDFGSCEGILFHSKLGQACFSETLPKSVTGKPDFVLRRLSKRWRSARTPF